MIQKLIELLNQIPQDCGVVVDEHHDLVFLKGGIIVIQVYRIPITSKGALILEKI